MAADLTLKLSNRSSKKPVKKLPPSIDLAADATVLDAKKAVAKKTGISDFNRIGLFDPATNKTLKDKNALLRDLEPVKKDGHLLVRDLGLQMAWRTVFMIEYLGPLLFHPLILGLRQYIYPPVYPYVKDYVPQANFELNDVQLITFAMVMLHFFKREYETMFVHRFSANTMPAWNIFRNSFFYWAVAGLLGALEVYAPISLAATAEPSNVRLILGLVLYSFGEISNLMVHMYLRSLRSPGGTERQIPVGMSFSLVTCPNYMFEIIAWAGIVLISLSPSLLLFISIGSLYMYQWGWQKERAYRKEFGDKYKKKRCVMLPGLL